ncbi:MAG: hypothetical protein ACFFDP_02350 [Promethearchaeota archaeon]
MSWTLILANLAPVFLGLGGVAAFSWFVDVLMGEVYRPSKGEEEKTNDKEEKTDAVGWRRGVVRLVGLLGIPFGVLCFISLISILLNPGHPYGDLLTMGLLAWTGIALFLTPISKLPWAALMGLAAGIIAVIAVIIIAPLIPEFILEQIALKWILIGVFVIVGVLVFGLFKWAESLLELICTILGSRPLLLVLSFACVIQAIALVLFVGNGGILWLFIH